MKSQLHIASLEIRPATMGTATFEAIASLTRAIKVQKKGEDTSIFSNYITDNFGEDILAVLDINALYSFKLEKEATFKEKKEMENAKMKALTNAFLQGISFEGKEYEFLTSTPSQKKQGKATFCLRGKRAEILAHFGMDEESFDGSAFVKNEDKLLPNMMSGQSEGSIAKADLGMKNIFIIASRDDGTLYRHELKNRKIQKLNTVGIMQGKVHNETIFNKVGDANGIVIREFLPAFRTAFNELYDGEQGKTYIETLRIAFENGKLAAIEKEIHARALRDEIDLYWVEQSRGKGLKATLTDAPVIRWSFELGINAIDGFFGETKTFEELFAENKAILVSEDCLKAKNLWNSAEKWQKWCENGYAHILCCDNGHVSCLKSATKHRILTSRQHLCPIVGASKESVHDFCAETREAIESIINEGTETTKLLAKIFGNEERETAMAKAFDSAALIPARNKAESGRVSVPGTWAMCIWDLKPIIAIAAHLDNEESRQELIAKARTLFGQTAALSNHANEKVAALGRYPSLGKNLMQVRIVKTTDICDNAIMMGWDIAANDVMKADTDGDHLPTYFAESNEEREMTLIEIRKSELA